MADESPRQRVNRLAKDMASYIHHHGYPVYDGGHSEPEEECQHPDCLAVRLFDSITKDSSLTSSES